MGKQELLAEAAELGIEFPEDPAPTNREIREAIEAAVSPADEPADEPAEDVVVSESDEPVFRMAQLKPYAEQLFGVGSHVIVGAVSAGCIPDGKVTKSQVRTGIDQYLNMPVEQG